MSNNEKILIPQQPQVTLKTIPLELFQRPKLYHARLVENASKKDRKSPSDKQDTRFSFLSNYISYSRNLKQPRRKIRNTGISKPTALHLSSISAFSLLYPVCIVFRQIASSLESHSDCQFRAQLPRRRGVHPLLVP